MSKKKKTEKKIYKEYFLRVPKLKQKENRNLQLHKMKNHICTAVRQNPQKTRFIEMSSDKK